MGNKLNVLTQRGWACVAVVCLAATIAGTATMKAAPAVKGSSQTSGSLVRQGTVVMFGSRLQPGQFLKSLGAGPEVGWGRLARKNDPTALFKVIPGLANPDWVSFESVARPGHFLRHAGHVLWLHPLEDNDLYRHDATFEITPGFADNTGCSVHPLDYPTFYWCQRVNFVRQEPEPVDDKAKTDFRNAATFRLIEGNALASPPEAEGGRHGQSAAPELDQGQGKVITFESRLQPGDYLKSLGEGPKVGWGRLEGKDDPTARFKVRPGLADPNGVSFESVARPGHFLRHAGHVIWLNPLEPSDLFKADATFAIKPGLADPAAVSLQPFNYPELRWRQRGPSIVQEPLQALLDADAAKRAATFAIVVCPTDTRDSGRRGAIGGSDLKAETVVRIVFAGQPPSCIQVLDDHTTVLLVPVGDQAPPRTQFRVKPGLADPGWVSFESVDQPGSYLRHYRSRLRLSPFDGGDLLKGDTTFRLLKQTGNGEAYSLQSYNFQNWVLGPDGSGVGVKDKSTVSPAESAFILQPVDDRPQAATPRIAFVGRRSADSFLETIYTMAPDGSNVTPVMGNRTVQELYPAWSPDGSKIAFVMNWAGASSTGYHIWVVNSDGSHLVRLTDTVGEIVRHPAWSPDGKMICFTRGQNAGGYGGEIWGMAADGTNQVRLTHNDVSIADRCPAWSPDGKRIAFTSDRDGDLEIYVMNVDGSSPLRLTNHPARDEDPAWSPDGEQIAFASDRDESWDIYTMDADGSGVTRLTDHMPWCSGPSWSPDGAKIAFASGRDQQRHQIYVMNADGSGLVRLTNSQGPNWSPAWAPRSR